MLIFFFFVSYISFVIIILYVISFYVLPLQCWVASTRTNKCLLHILIFVILCRLCFLCYYFICYFLLSITLQFCTLDLYTAVFS
jgi:hypothetical protein